MLADNSSATPATPEVHPEIHHPEGSESHEPSTHNRILGIAIDDSENSTAAFEWACKNLIKPDDLVLLLTVRPLAVSPTPYYGVSYIDFTEFVSEMDKKYHTAARDLIKKYSKQLSAHKIHHKGVIMKGDPRDELVKIVEDMKIETLVVGSRGLGAIKRALLGSVSDHLAHHVPCPLVVVRGPGEKKSK